MEHETKARGQFLHVGLFFTTLALLMQELLDSRLLSVVVAYHLSFLAISTAMLGGAAGAVYVFVRGARLSGERARAALPRWAAAYAVVLAASQLAMLRVQVRNQGSPDVQMVLDLSLVTLLLTIPFFVAGVTVTLALTRVGGRIGVLYAFDLAGAALGCLLVVPLLNHTDMGAALLVAATAAAAGSACFARAFSPGWGRLHVALAGVLGVCAGVSMAVGCPVELAYLRGRPIRPERIDRQVWNAHSHVVIGRPHVLPAFVWGRGRQPKIESVVMFIDGDAGTPMTRWDGDPTNLGWLDTDVSALAHRLRPEGEVAIIGVGGGRDVLSGLYGRARSVTAVEINRTFIDALQNSHRDFASVAKRPEVTLIHDDGRSFMERYGGKFDVLEMSMVDTWASTVAGAFTLTENALYTREGWAVFLRRLKTGGILSTSRWFARNKVSETHRLVGLSVGALLDVGVIEPENHLAMVASGPVANLLVSRTPFTRPVLEELWRACREQHFELLLAPRMPENDRNRHLLAIARSRNDAELHAALADPHFDYQPPTDERPYFFNMLKLSSLWALMFSDGEDALPRTRGVLWGNMRATGTLAVLSVLATVLVVLLVLFPLLRSGLPSLPAPTFAGALGYFAVLGAGFMLIQIGLLQRFSVYLGHPIYSYVVILFTMILAAGVGSYLSERIALDDRRWARWLGPAIAVYALGLAFVLPVVLANTHRLQLGGRALLVAAIVAPLACLMGCCFPLGMRLMDRLAAEAKPWMWGVNGSLGVLASIAAVVVSMYVGISANFVLAGALYALLSPLARYLLSAMGPTETGSPSVPPVEGLQATTG